jgi:hypothetical protein
MKSIIDVHGILTPKLKTIGHFSGFFEVWAGHCGCNICPKNLKILVNTRFSTSFKTH